MTMAASLYLSCSNLTMWRGKELRSRSGPIMPWYNMRLKREAVQFSYVQTGLRL